MANTMRKVLCKSDSFSLLRRKYGLICNTFFGLQCQHTAATFEGPGLEHFIANSHTRNVSVDTKEKHYMPSEWSKAIPERNKVHIETYGCQMNTSDTEVAWSILKDSGYELADRPADSDVTLLMTCAIREGAEDKIWERIRKLKKLKRRKRYALKIGILGCMAERLKTQILERERLVDVVCGPDAYRDLPRLLAETEGRRSAVNVQLSLEETYADVTPVRMDAHARTAYVSIMRGCDNMCSYCIVPFTRGRERSRPMTSILDEVRALSDQGVREVTLLGQNVNSYRDLSEKVTGAGVDLDRKETTGSAGFRTIYKPKRGGRRFADLVAAVADLDPEMRIRFTAPHPKDFPDELLHLIRDTPNVCNQLHLPAQSGSTDVLARMRRGYSAEAYRDLVIHIRESLPQVAFTSDFIAGFCGGTPADHVATVDLIKWVKYNFTFCYPYSMRGKTHAHHRLQDDVTEEDKKQRHLELHAVGRQVAAQVHAEQVGQEQLVLIERTSRRSERDWMGRNDAGTIVIVPGTPVPDGQGQLVTLGPGDYVKVKVTGSTSQVLHSVPIEHTTLTDYHRKLEGDCESVTAQSVAVSR